MHLAARDARPPPHDTGHLLHGSRTQVGFPALLQGAVEHGCHVVARLSRQLLRGSTIPSGPLQETARS